MTSKLPKMTSDAKAVLPDRVVSSGCFSIHARILSVIVPTATPALVSATNEENCLGAVHIIRVPTAPVVKQAFSGRSMAYKMHHELMDPAAASLRVARSIAKHEFKQL